MIPTSLDFNKVIISNREILKKIPYPLLLKPWQNKLDCFSKAHFQPSLIFVDLWIFNLGVKLQIVLRSKLELGCLNNKSYF
jgi:hypothetical protein